MGGVPSPLRAEDSLASVAKSYFEKAIDAAKAMVSGEDAEEGAVEIIVDPDEVAREAALAAGKAAIFLTEGNYDFTQSRWGAVAIARIPRLRRRVHPDLVGQLQPHPDAHDRIAVCQRIPTTRPSQCSTPAQSRGDRRQVRHRKTLSGLRRRCSPIRTSTPSTSTRRSPTTRAVDRRAQGGQTRRLHRADGHQRRGLPRHRRNSREDRPPLHDDGDRRVRPRVPLHEGALQKGELGKLQFLQASHQQDMDGWPGYWPGLPPMHYATHCVGPVLALPERRRNT
jgi:hypothetical protein